MEYFIGIDVGGTKINSLIIGADGRVHFRIKKPTGLYKETIKDILGIISLLLKKEKKIKGIGIGFPGLINREKGIAIKAPNIKGWKKTNLKKIIKEKFNLPLKIENDANCFALAEQHFGAGKGAKNVIGITLGTGIGGGIIINNRLYTGAGGAGEIGHMSIMQKGIRCSCGNNGCWEEYLSVRAIKRIGYNTFTLKDLALKKDKRAIAVFNQMGEILGIGLTNLNNLLNPDLFVIGGGLSNLCNLLLSPAKSELKKALFPIRIKLAKLGDDAGAIGAASLFLE